MQPDSRTLLQIFGDDTPIGKVSTRDFENGLTQNESTESLAKKICDYAEALHKEQNDYSNISPFGGEDIIVESVAVIALRVVPEYYNVLSGVSVEALEDSVCAELLNRGKSFDSITDFVSAYRQLKDISTSEYPENECQRYQAEMDVFKKNVQHRVKEIREEGRAECDKIEAKISELKSHRIKNFFFPERYQHQLEQFNQVRDFALNKANATSDTLFAECDPDDLGRPYPARFFFEGYHPDFPRNEDSYYTFFDSQEHVAAFKEMAKKFVEEHKGKFEQYSNLLARNQRTQGKDFVQQSPSETATTYQPHQAR